MGGDCLNTGCVPSKAIIRTAKLLYDARTAHRFGLSPSPLSPPTRGGEFTSLPPPSMGGGIGGRVDLFRVMASVHEVQEQIAHHDSVERFTALGVDVHLGEYRFITPHQISNGKEVLGAKRFVIATGASPFVPPIPGLDKTPYLTSDNVWQLKELPQNLIILGGGPIGAELAQTFARLGSLITVVEMADRLLIREDPEVSELVKKRFEAEGLTVLLKTRAMEVKENRLIVSNFTLPQPPPPVGGDKGEGAISFDQILVAVGRAPNVNNLSLEKAGVAYDKKGVKVDAYLRTSQKHIYACGDVIGSYQFTHTADFQARLILRNALFPGKSKIDYRVVPWCTFTEPEVARVGLNESEAKQNNVAHTVYQYALSDLDRAVCDREDEGFMKVLTKKGTDQILGVTLVGSHAGDLLHELALAMHQKIGLKKVASMIHVYPTLAEVSKRIADTYQRTRLTDSTKKWLKRYFQWRFG